MRKLGGYIFYFKDKQSPVTADDFGDDYYHGISHRLDGPSTITPICYYWEINGIAVCWTVREDL